MTDSRVSHEGLEVIQSSTTVESAVTHLGLEVIMKMGTATAGPYWGVNLGN